MTTTGYVLPLKASSNNRYLVDQNGTPFLIMGDSPQALVGNLGPTDMATYMADRERLGFNALWVNLLCDNATPTAMLMGPLSMGWRLSPAGPSPSNYDLSTPNSAYFSRVDSMVNMAATYNLVVFLDPIETGGWLVTLENNGTTKAYNYGVYIGTRYKNFPNIVWLHGNDFQTLVNSSSTDNNLVKQVMAGIASVDSNHLQTIELNYNSSYSNQDSALASLLTLDSAYTYFETYDIVLQSYNSSPTIPTYLVEANYEYENNTGALPGPAGPYVLREQAYWTMLSGGAGQIYGNHYTMSFTSGWQSFLDSPGDLEIQYINQLFGSVAWWDLVPDQTHQIVTAGYGTYNGSNRNLTTATYCTTSWISGSLALTYCPNPSTLTVNLAKFSRPRDGPMVRSLEWHLHRDLGIAISEFWQSCILPLQATTTTEIRTGCWCCTYKRLSGVAVCQRLQHILTPLCNRNLRYLDDLISVQPAIPILHGAVDRLSVLERVVAFVIVHVDRLPRGQDEDLGTVLVLREPHAQLALVQGCDAIESAKSIKDASIKEDIARGRSVMNKILDVHSQRFVRELVRIRSRTQPAPTAVLDDGARAIADDGVAASLQRQQERGLPCAGAACDYYSRHATVPCPLSLT